MDKLERLKKEIERRRSKHSKTKRIESALEDNAILSIIDSLQEEPKPQFKVGDTIRNKVWESAVHKIVYIDDSAYFFENGGMVRFDDQEQWELAEEPISEELEEAAKNHAAERYRVTRNRELAEKCKWSFKAGAQWQKKQDSMLPKIWPRENLDDFAYQVAYDLSNDWMRETPTWDDVEAAVKLGAKWKSEYPDDNYDWLEYQLNLKLPETLDYNGVKVDREDFIRDILKAMKEDETLKKEMKHET